MTYLQLASSLLSLADYLIHPTENLDHWDPDYHHDNLAIKKPKGIDKIGYILNNSCRMLHIKSLPG
jgi:3-oxoacyl-(acyl-carrier-protein) synthase